MIATALDRGLHIVHTEASRGWGGQEIRVLTEAKGMIGRGHRVEIWAPSDSDILREAIRQNIPATPLAIGAKRLSGVLAMRRAIATSRPDVINTHSSTDAWLAAVACRTLHRSPPMVRTRHISAAVPTNAATRWLYQRATRHIVTTGERLRRTLIEENRFRADEITSVPTGVDSDRFRPGDPLSARKALGLDPENRYIGIVATLRSWKGHLFLIDAFARLVRDDGRLRLVIVGDGPMRGTLQARVDALDLRARVLFAGRQEAVERWLQAFDVFCLPSYANEGVPQALVQAMLCALPVVSTRVGSIDEAVAHEDSGILVAPRDVDQLAGALARLLADAPLRERLGRRARISAASAFGSQSMLERMEAIFRRVVDAQQQPR